jgi:catechol 2,3-dioxygenase-like lactoylglutathione lyase family enzyme
MKTHISLGTHDVEQAVRFYSVLLDAQPAKRLADYALFITEEPGLELALDHGVVVSLSRDDHFGICVESVEAVERAIARLRRAGLDVDVERDDVCCYAKQTKVWATDPDGHRWETYHVLEETEDRDGGDGTCCRDGGTSAEPCCAD